MKAEPESRWSKIQITDRDEYRKQMKAEPESRWRKNTDNRSRRIQRADESRARKQMEKKYRKQIEANTESRWR